MFLPSFLASQSQWWPLTTLIISQKALQWSWMISFWGCPLYSTSWIFYRTSDSKQKGGFFHSKIFQEWLYFWLPFFISSCSTFLYIIMFHLFTFQYFCTPFKIYTSSVFSHQLFQASFPISPGICMNTLPKKPTAKNTTSKSVRTPSFKEAMKSAARPLLLPLNPFVLCELDVREGRFFCFWITPRGFVSRKKNG